MGTEKTQDTNVFGPVLGREILQFPSTFLGPHWLMGSRKTAEAETGTGRPAPMLRNQFKARATQVVRSASKAVILR